MCLTDTILFQKCDSTCCRESTFAELYLWNQNLFYIII